MMRLFFAVFFLLTASVTVSAAQEVGFYVDETAERLAKDDTCPEEQHFDEKKGSCEPVCIPNPCGSKFCVPKDKHGYECLDCYTDGDCPIRYGCADNNKCIAYCDAVFENPKEMIGKPCLGGIIYKVY
ncbi:MAG: hypothetical protein ACI4PW_08715 [Alphaproteobacteria bacterium]